jgi:AcrR family transcriptional regulator
VIPVPPVDSAADVKKSGRAERRAAIVRAAVSLFAERGYKETTATQIAERAGVSRRLFFYYFPSKDDVLFAVSDEAMVRLRELVRQQPARMTDLDAVAAAWKQFGSPLDGSDGSEQRAVVLQLRRAAASSPLLRGKEYELHLAYTDAVARGLADRRGLSAPDASALTAAAIGQTLMHLVVDRLVADEDAEREVLIDDQFAAARAVLIQSSTGQARGRSAN